MQTRHRDARASIDSVVEMSDHRLTPSPLRSRFNASLQIDIDRGRVTFLFSSFPFPSREIIDMKTLPPLSHLFASLIFKRI